MIKHNYRYDQNSARLNIEGLPDKSLDHSPEIIGILSNWQLQLVGAPILEGKRNHLESLISVVFSYTRHTLSGVKKSFGDISDPVNISPYGSLHKIRLNSSQENTKPLEIDLDDAQLADLVRCLDDLLQDKRVAITWNTPENNALKYSDIIEKVAFTERFIAPLFGPGVL